MSPSERWQNSLSSPSRDRINHMIIKKSSFSKCFPSTLKTQSRRFQIPQVWRGFSESFVRDQTISVIVRRTGGWAGSKRESARALVCRASSALIPLFCKLRQKFRKMRRFRAENSDLTCSDAYCFWTHTGYPQIGREIVNNKFTASKSVIICLKPCYYFLPCW